VIQTNIKNVFILSFAVKSQHCFNKNTKIIKITCVKILFFTVNIFDLVKKKIPRYVPFLHRSHTLQNNKKSVFRRSEAEVEEGKKAQNVRPKVKTEKTVPEDSIRERKYLVKHHKICKYGYNYNYDYFNLLLILSNDVESNPGPKEDNLNVATYNVQGCRDLKKLKRLCNRLHKAPFGRNWVFNLQETHLLDRNILPYHWKWGNVQSPGSGNSSGVAILYNKSYFDKILDSGFDNEGKYCYLVSSKIDETYLFLNIYAPNDHYRSQTFFERINLLINSFVDSYPLINIIVSGDFNLVFDVNLDSIGRNQTKQEKRVVSSVQELMIKFNLKDSYRQINTYGGYTWGKNNPTFLRSRLDYILVSKNLANSLITSSIKADLNESDHCLLYSEFVLDSCKYGQGIVRCNASLLDDPEIKDKIEKKLKECMDNDTIGWNAHRKLDYYKFKLRLLLLEEGRKKSKMQHNRLEMANLEINRLKQHLDNLLCNIKGNEIDDSTFGKIASINEAIELAEESISDIKEEESRRLIFRSRAKWAEEGEKSTKYFLNLLKDRQKKLQIRRIISNGQTFIKQDEITKAIGKFYKKLYSKQDNLKKVDQSEKMFQGLPKLSDEDCEMLKQPISLEELTRTLNTCKESAPGLDGISYDTYKSLWSQAGPLILGAWEYSNKIDETSVSQRNSVITLLEKKGKDRSIIENLRPISLSNCDIKICTKAIALRTNLILHKLVDKTQTGYVPGRQVTDNNRLIEEIIDMAHDKNELYYLVTLDARKAFDSVDHQYLLDILKVYNFPQEYIKWISILYRNLESSVLVNGFLTDPFGIGQSVKQGDALSCALFILSIEPLIRSIRNNTLIEPITLNDIDGGDEINTASFADDITALAKNIEAVKHIISEYDKFSSYSGISLNVAKTEIMIIGKKDRTPIKFSITSRGETYDIYDQEAVTICGITFSNNKDLAYKENITNKIIKLERQLDIWRGRQLTLEGKILIVKTFGISQLIYSLQSTVIKTEDLRKIDDIIFRFIWNIKKSNKISSGKINRTIMKAEIEKGGLNAPDIEIIDKSIKYKNLLRHTQTTSKHPLASIYKSKLENCNFSFENFHSNGTVNGFLGLGIKMHKEVGKKITNNIKLICNDDGIHKNYHSFVQNINLIRNQYTNANQNHMLHRLLIHNIINFYDLYKEKTNPRFQHLALDVQLVYYSFPIELRTLISKQTRTHPPIRDEVEIALNKWIEVSRIPTKVIKGIFSTSQTLPNPLIKIIEKHNIRCDIDYLNPYLCLKQSVKNVRFRNIQYKILQNIYPTMKHLHTWKIKQNPECGACGLIETIEHATYKCHIANSTFKKLSEILNIEMPTYETVLLGSSSTRQYSCSLNKKASYGLDNILIGIKQRLILQREDKIELTLEEIGNTIKKIIQVEKYNSNKIGNIRQYKDKWGWIENLIIQTNIE